MTRYIKTRWQVWDYDAWESDEDGWQVTLYLRVETLNPGTASEFVFAMPSDRQLRRVFGLPSGTAIVTGVGDDVSIYPEDEAGYPLGEIFCLSHESLSPIGRHR